MKEKNSVYHVWVKGSQRSDGSVGAAWKIVHGDRETTGSTVPKLDKGDKPRGADIAEIIAVERALQQIPVEAEVHLRVGADNVAHMLGMGMKPRNEAPQRLKSVFESTMSAIDRLSSFRIEKAGGKRNEHMSEVGDLARAASGQSSHQHAALRRNA